MKVNSQSIAPKTNVGNKMGFSQIIALPSYQAMLANAIQDTNKRQRFITNIIGAVNSVPKLKDCKPDSIITAALQMESLGLTHGLGDAYIIPYGENAQFQMGARGYVQLAMRSGQYLEIDTIEVRSGEYLGRNKQNGKPIFEFIEDDDAREQLPVIGYLAYFTLLNGFYAQEYFSHAKMIAWADRYSQSFSIDLYNKYQKFLETGEGLNDRELRMVSSPWYSSFDSMASKTVLKRLLSKKGVLSVELVDAFKNDQKDGTSDGLFEMNFQDEPKQEVIEEETVVETEPTLETAEKAEQPIAETHKRGRKPKAEQQKPTAIIEDFDAFDDTF